MSFEKFYSIFREHFKPPYPELFQSRQDLLCFIDDQKRFDVVVAGGGIHGAVCARLAALCGLKVLLLEKDDYASETVRRMPDFLSLALLERRSWKLLDICSRQKRLRAVSSVAPHLVEIAPFSLRASKREQSSRLKAQILMQAHQLVLDAKCPAGEREDICLPRVLLNEPRFVLENILAARQEGAACLNHACVDVVSQNRDGGVEVAWADMLSHKRHESRCGVVLNCTGAAAPFFCRISPHVFAKELKYLHEICLYIACSWKGPARIIAGGKGASPVAVAPTAGGVVVSAFLQELGAASKAPQVNERDLAALMDEVRREIPELPEISGSSCHMTDTLRTMLRDAKKSFASKWFYTQGVLHLFGSWAGDAFNTASEGVGRVLEMSRISYAPISLYERPLPGAWRIEELSRDIKDTAESQGGPASLVEKAISRYGTLLRLVMEDTASLDSVSATALKGELQLAVRLEQAENLEDLVLRRLCMPILPEPKDEFLKNAAAFFPA